MKKSILVGVLAALMLFAFTACENKAPTSPLYGKNIESIKPVEYPVIVTDGTTLLSEPFTMADFTFDVVFDDGSTEQYTGYELKAEVNNEATSSGILVLSVSYGSANKPAKFNVSIPYYEAKVTALDVSGAKVTTVEPNSASVKSEGLELVYTYDGSKTITTEASSVTAYLGRDFGFPTTSASGTPSVDWDNIEEGAKYDFELSEGFATSLGISDSVEVIGTWTLTVETPEIPVSDIVVEQDDENEIFVGDTLADVMYSMSFMYGDDEVVLYSDESLGTSTEGWTLEYYNYETTYEFEKTGKTSDITVVATNAATGTEVSKDLSVEVIKDYPATFTVALNEEAVEKDKKEWIADGNIIDPKYFTFTIATWASSNSTTCADSDKPNTSVASSNFTGLTRIKLGTAVDSQITPEFAYKTPGLNTEKVSKPTAAITVVAASTDADK